ncbi:nuclease-related domain-containing protein [Cellulomonas fimi]|uniref:NERD domain protein n=1 Tax=Cellulomonas fimi (strain ATCC 484 / DSM 20113 / JCM 1341 / CCUG 24087 / LMG 16345 / NBRC 15513 / NCIMB 8980 / NCTC 7547 / NRS-133) TaxID=590998 RepID=F4H2C3_CELFA|nr:nuclease-related domain-containing protein [Cellulomonas fimi]AEE47543.1 NERD domain protein [Cellulomonas fimi ATCC 484]NNH07948.1 NERD domain-containing protein [Cellulomonas fimi]VEH36501.1 Nuclease-related domain [Cellulomonas fimi]
MGEFETRHWRRYGKDRTYVLDVATGVQIGYRDNVSGELVPADASTARVLDRWACLADAGFTFATPPAPTGPTAPAVPSLTIPGGEGPRKHTRPPRLDEDLSVRAAGQGARKRANEELEARRAQLGRFRTWVGKVVDARTDERAWRIGAAAEESIGAELERLTPYGWRILHSVPVGANSSDIDHVLIGPPGVFTVNSKHHPGANIWVVSKQVRVNNQPVPYLRNSRHEAARASALLTAAAGVPVTAAAVLVFRLGSGSLTVREHPGDVLVLRATKAARALRALPPSLTAEQVGVVYDAAKRRSTWQPS